MITYLITFLLALLVSVVTTPIVRNVARSRGWVEPTNNRKVHRTPVPRLGGIAIVLGFFAPLVGLLLVDSSVGAIYKASPNVIAGLLGGGLAIAGLGLYDDFRGAGATKKFVIQFAVAIALWIFGFRIEDIATPIFGTVSLGAFSFPVTLLWTVGVINAVNLIDGLDGLAAGVAFFAVATNFLLAFSHDNILMCLTMASLAGAVLGFLVFNFNPASIFMGDTGSMFLGFVLAASSLKTSQKGGTAVALLVPILALGLPIMDTLLAMARRALGGRPMFSADKEHIHHRLMKLLRLNHARTVLVLYGVSCVFALTALGVSYANDTNSALLLLAVGVVVIVLVRALGYFNVRDASDVWKTRRRNIQLRKAVKTSVEQVHRAASLASMWDALRSLAGAMNASGLALRVGEGVCFDFVRETGGGHPLRWSFDIEIAGAKAGELSVSWCDERDEVNRDEQLALEKLGAVVSERLERLVVANPNTAEARHHRIGKRASTRAAGRYCERKMISETLADDAGASIDPIK